MRQRRPRPHRLGGQWLGYLSSTGVYGDAGGAWVDEDAPTGGRRTHVATGRFGADMRVALVNDGPVTFWLRIAPQPPA